MSQTEERQNYFEYDPRESGAWYRKDPPPRELWFEQELLDLAGKTDGKPNLRVVWGGTIMSDITYQPSLKYKAVRQITKGYNYLKKDGEIGFTKSMNLATDAKVPWEFHAAKERIELGRLRWAIERYVPASELRRLGRFTNLHAPDGERILRDFPNEGVYDHFFWVQTAAHKYRDLDREVLVATQAMWIYNTTVSEAQKGLDAIERAKNQTLIGADEANQIWQNLT